MSASDVSSAQHEAAFLRALWGDARPVAYEATTEASRSRFDEAGVVLAPACAGDRRLARATLAHIGAHRAYGPERFPVGTLKPAQIALVSLIEDARVERLAMLSRPGLRRLWLGFHVTGADSARTAPDLLARLARALIDPDYADPDPWVAKGRALFGTDPAAWRDPALSRRTGDLLGNDLGQMRVPFSGRNYVVQPVYRDDNSGLWEQPAQAAAPRPAPGSAPAQDVAQADAARTSHGDTPAPPPEPGTISRYPEWDYRIRSARPDWVTVTETTATETTATEPTVTVVGTSLDQRCRGSGVAQRSLARILPRRPAWSRPSPDGETLDLVAVLDALIGLKCGRPPEQRLYRRRTHPPAAVRALLLLDASQSTADPAPCGGGSVLDRHKEVALQLAAALESLAVPVMLQAFRSNGRHDARITRLKGWREGAALLRSRLGTLEPGLSTRLGAALRHAASTLDARSSGTALLLVLTDGEPSDIDIYDPRYLVEDARTACRALRRQRVEAYAVAVSTEEVAPLARIFGRRRAWRLRLPA